MHSGILESHGCTAMKFGVQTDTNQRENHLDFGEDAYVCVGRHMPLYLSQKVTD